MASGVNSNPQRVANQPVSNSGQLNVNGSQRNVQVRNSGSRPMAAVGVGLFIIGCLVSFYFLLNQAPSPSMNIF